MPKKPANETDDNREPAASEGWERVEHPTESYGNFDDMINDIDAASEDGITIDIVGDVDDAHMKAYHELGKNRYTVDMLAALPALYTLRKAGVITFADGDEWTPIWRTGHLEHVANLYAGDPATTERNYADDLAVARAYSADAWEKLTNG